MHLSYHTTSTARPFGSPFPADSTSAAVQSRFLTEKELLAAPPAADALRPYAEQTPPAAVITGPGTAQAPGGQPHAAWPARRGLSRRVLARACTYMEENLGETFTLDDLARAVGVSRFHFSRLFRVSTGVSPMVYFLRLRIERAKQMLVKGDRKMCEIALALGFFDQSHFSRTFRRMTGLAPGEYVRMCDDAEVTV
jgi:AraC-like DNA-binding protein